VADPVSWFMIEKGWAVEAVDGTHVGKVEEVIGDSSADIFSGLTMSSGLLRRPRYVPAERVAEIRDGSVRLSLGPAEVERLRDYEEPPPSEQIRPA
jgi:uncharacterized protein YrrD